MQIVIHEDDDIFETVLDMIKGGNSAPVTMPLPIPSMAEQIAGIPAIPPAAPAQVMQAASPVPVQPAPSAPAPTAPMPSGTVELDGEGLPWDARINAGTKNKTREGRWKKLKGVDEATYSAVKLELRSRFPNMQQTPGVPVSAGNIPMAPAAAPAAPPVAPVAPIPPAPAAAPAAPGVTWAQVCSVMNQKVSEGKLTPDGLNAIAAKHGVTPFAMIATRPDLWLQAYSDVMAV